MADREKRLRAMRERHAEKREAENARSRAWYQANKDRHAEAGRKWAEENADRLREYNAKR